MAQTLIEQLQEAEARQPGLDKIYTDTLAQYNIAYQDWIGGADNTATKDSLYIAVTNAANESNANAARIKSLRESILANPVEKAKLEAIESSAKTKRTLIYAGVFLGIVAIIFFAWKRWG